MKNRRILATALTLAMGCGAALAQSAPEIKDAWARSSVAGQKGSGAFMKITAKDGAKLVAASTPAAGVAEIHEMKMDGDIMRMRAVPGLDLPAGQTVELKPGGYHVMLMDLKAPLAAGSKLPLTLVFQDAKGAQSKVELQVPVATAAPGAAPAAAGGGMDHSAHKH